MIFLLNRERVLSEVMEWFKLRACHALKLEPDKFGLTLALDESGNLTPDVQVDRADIEGVTDEHLQELLGGLYKVAVSMYNERIEGLTA